MYNNSVSRLCQKLITEWYIFIFPIEVQLTHNITLALVYAIVIRQLSMLRYSYHQCSHRAWYVLTSKTGMFSSVLSVFLVVFYMFFMENCGWCVSPAQFLCLVFLESSFPGIWMALSLSLHSSGLWSDHSNHISWYTF